MIPAKYTCEGRNISPPLKWTSPPQGTKSFAIIVDDPDAPMGTWVHWVIYNIPSDTMELKENIPAESLLSDGTTQGITDYQKIGYKGPCPPGGTHRYFFRIYALDTELSLDPGATKKELLKAMEGHILDKANLIGRFKRG